MLCCITANTVRRKVRIEKETVTSKSTRAEKKSNRNTINPLLISKTDRQKNLKSSSVPLSPADF